MNRKQYQREYRRGYRKTVNGLLVSILATQRYKAKRDGVEVLYTNDEFFSWVNKHPSIFTLFNGWVSSKFNKDKRPLVYRKKKGNFSFDNLKIGTIEQFYQERARSSVG